MNLEAEKIYHCIIWQDCLSGLQTATVEVVLVDKPGMLFVPGLPMVLFNFSK